MVGSRRTWFGSVSGFLRGRLQALRDTYRPSITDGPSDHTPRVASGAYFQREGLGGVEPRDGQPRCSEDGSEEEDEEDGAATYARVISTSGFRVDRGASKATGAEHTDTLAD